MHLWVLWTMSLCVQQQHLCGLWNLCTYVCVTMCMRPYVGKPYDLQTLLIVGDPGSSDLEGGQLLLRLPGSKPCISAPPGG